MTRNTWCEDALFVPDPAPFSPFTSKAIGSQAWLLWLELDGFAFITHRGSHAKYTNPAGRITIVPHPRRGLPMGTTGRQASASTASKTAVGAPG